MIALIKMIHYAVNSFITAIRTILILMLIIKASNLIIKIDI